MRTTKVIGKRIEKIIQEKRGRDDCGGPAIPYVVAIILEDGTKIVPQTLEFGYDYETDMNVFVPRICQGCGFSRYLMDGYSYTKEERKYCQECLEKKETQQ